MQFNLTGRFAKAGGPKLREIFAVSIVDVCKLCHSPLDHCLCSSWWQSCTGTDRRFEEQGVFTTKLANNRDEMGCVREPGSVQKVHTSVARTEPLGSPLTPLRRDRRKVPPPFQEVEVKLKAYQSFSNPTDHDPTCICHAWPGEKY